MTQIPHITREELAQAAQRQQPQLLAVLETAGNIARSLATAVEEMSYLRAELREAIKEQGLGSRIDPREECADSAEARA